MAAKTSKDVKEVKETKQCLSCVDCGVMNCSKRTGQYPEFCPTAALTQEEIDEVTNIYLKSRINKKVAVAAAEIEGEFYGRYTRVEEIIEFAKRIGAKKIGIATCIGLLEESRVFAKILRLNGFEVYGVSCKSGSVNKTTVGVDPKFIIGIVSPSPTNCGKMPSHC